MLPSTLVFMGYSVEAQRISNRKSRSAANAVQQGPLAAQFYCWGLESQP